jgi:hypothetical protein
VIAAIRPLESAIRASRFELGAIPPSVEAFVPLRILST